MPNDKLPEGWVSFVLGGIAAAAAFLGRWLFTRFFHLEKRVEALEAQAALTEDRHLANLERLDRIDATVNRIDEKLDRLIERA